MTGKLKQNFPANYEVIIRRTGDPNLDFTRAKVIGLAMGDHIVDFYIIELPTPLPNGYRAITMIESCLDPAWEVYNG